MVDTMVYYNITILYVYIIDYTTGVCSQPLKFTLPGHILKHLCFFEFLVALSVTFILGFVLYMD